MQQEHIKGKPTQILQCQLTSSILYPRDDKK